MSYSVAVQLSLHLHSNNFLSRINQNTIVKTNNVKQYIMACMGVAIHE
jgi:hypothetical protein